MEKVFTALCAIIFVVAMGSGGNARAQGRDCRCTDCDCSADTGDAKPAAPKANPADDEGESGKITCVRAGEFTKVTFRGKDPEGGTMVKVRAIGTQAQVWVPEECGEPEVETYPRYKGQVKPVLGEKEEDGVNGRVASGWRIIVYKRSGYRSSVMPFIKVTIGDRIYHVGVRYEQPKSNGAAMRLAEEAKGDAQDAKRTAEEAKREAGKRGKGEKLSFGLGGFYAAETAGKPGGGAYFTLTGDVWRPSRFFSFGLGAKMLVQGYELQFRGDLEMVNSDAIATQIDAGAFVEPRLKLFGWASLYLQAGFGMRILVMPDTIPIRNIQVEGGTDWGGVFFIRLGATIWFGPESPVGLDLGYLFSVSLNDMVQNPGGSLGFVRYESNVINHLVTLGLRFRIVGQRNRWQN